MTAGSTPRGRALWGRRHVLLLSGLSLAAGACTALRGSPAPGAGAPSDPATDAATDPATEAVTDAATDRVSTVGAIVPSVGPLLWSDEFDGATGAGVDTRTWTVRTGAGGWGNRELQCYTDSPDNVSLDGAGNLLLTMRRQDVVDAAGNRAAYTSGRIETVQTFDASRVEARMRIPRGPALWSAFWTVGADIDTVGWPRCGEVDVVEHYDEADSVEVVAHAAVLGPDGATVERWKQMEEYPVAGIEEDFHVYAVDIGAEELVFSLDGVTQAVIRRSERADGEDWPFGQPQRLTLNLAMSRWLGDADPGVPASLVVDWVRVYAREQ